MQSRTQLLARLLDYTHPLEQTVADLRQFPWDSEAALVVLSRQHIMRLLERYLRGELTESDVEAWANAIEGREDIDYEAGHGDVPQEAVHILANPVLTEPLDRFSAGRLLDALQ